MSGRIQQDSNRSMAAGLRAAAHTNEEAVEEKELEEEERLRTLGARTRVVRSFDRSKLCLHPSPLYTYMSAHDSVPMHCGKHFVRRKRIDPGKMTDTKLALVRRDVNSRKIQEREGQANVSCAGDHEIMRVCGVCGSTDTCSCR